MTFTRKAFFQIIAGVASTLGAKKFVPAIRKRSGPPASAMMSAMLERFNLHAVKMFETTESVAARIKLSGHGPISTKLYRIPLNYRSVAAGKIKS